MMIADNSLAVVKAMIGEISDLTPHEEDLAFPAWSLALSESSFSRAADCPFAPGSEPYSIVEHTHAVTQGALALADMVQKIHGIQVNRSLLALAALIHDTGKLVETEFAEGGGSRKSHRGETIPHGFFSGHYALPDGLPDAASPPTSWRERWVGK